MGIELWVDHSGLDNLTFLTEPLLSYQDLKFNCYDQSGLEYYFAFWNGIVIS